MGNPKELSGYPQEFFTAWELALKNELRLDMPTKGGATNFKQRLYAFRKLLAKDNPSEGAKYYEIDLRVSQDPITHLYFIESYVPIWKQALRAAAGEAQKGRFDQPGVDMIAPSHEPPMPVPTIAEVKDNLNDSLNKLGFGTEEKGK